MSAPEQQIKITTQDTSRQLDISRGGIVLGSIKETMEFCLIVAKSRMAPRGLETPEALFVAVTYGAEIGLAPMTAIQNICVINNRPTVWGDVALALVKTHPECEDVIESMISRGDDDDGLTAICTVTRKGKAPVTRKFTKKMAVTAGLWGKAGPWTTNPPRMIQMRARGFALRDAFPDALKGIGIREEVQDYAPARAHEVKPSKPLVLPDGETLALENETPPESVEQPREAGGGEPDKIESPGAAPCDEEGRLL